MKFINTKLATRSAIAIMLSQSAYAGGPTVQNDRFTNIGSIANTRHNMTQSTAPLIAADMDRYRNDYGEVCVYCHTPHAANTTIALPLWNRTNKATTYNTYNSSTITQPVSQPGPNSLSCLSCHDGTVAIDSIINMPGGGGYLASQETSQNTAFLDTWNPPVGSGKTDATLHMGLNSRNGLVGDGAGSQGCLSCHSETGANGGGLVDFTVFNIGTDLRNDHPVGIRYPIQGQAIMPGVDFRPTTAVYRNIAFFDNNTNGNPDPSEIRLYNTGQGFEVECASCHDPHGVPSNGTGTVNNKTFMRVSNSGSGLCLTCHVK